MGTWRSYKEHFMSDNEYYEEKKCCFYNLSVIFSIKSGKRGETVLSFKEAHNGAWRHYKVKGSVNYAKKIADNAVIALNGAAVDCDDIDLFLRKSFSLRKTNSVKDFSKQIQNI